ncbi:MAG: hybrid sensor histidine kinase/response regulator [bacterium]|nr:hybrid sensor histidine kinase/response regulator [bacterium]
MSAETTSFTSSGAVTAFQHPASPDDSEIVRGQLLVIDDEEEILKALSRQFRRKYAVHIAHSADDGLRIMTEYPIQVIISDQRMPGMNGVEFFNRVKSEYPDAIRLLLTGYADIQAVIAAINDGNVFRYIPKPWDPVELETIVNEAFQRYRLIVQNRELLSELQAANALLEKRVEARTAELAEANARLQQMDATKDAFLGMAAHDLRTPITIIRGYTDLLLDPRTSTDNMREFIEHIRATTQEMLDLLNDLLDITAIQSGKITLQPDIVDVYRFIDRVVKLNRRIGEQKGIALVTDIPAGLPPFMFDPGRIEQVMNNLISNAFKFSHSGTTVTVAAALADEMLEFSITDEGQGIPAHEMDKLFNAFQKVSPKPTGSERSTGLGLSICKRLVELHYGVIDAESQPGVGSRFYFRLPRTFPLVDEDG